MLEITIHVEAPELAGAINNLATALAKQHSTEAANGSAKNQVPASVESTADPVTSTPAPVEPAVPVAAPPQYTVEQIMEAGATLMDAGKINDLMNLLHKFGVQAVMDLKPEQLGAFATEMRELGAKI